MRTLRAVAFGALTGALLASCTPAASKQEAATPPVASSAKEAMIRPTRSGYADVNGIKLYHEVYGAGEPLVLVHG